MTKTDHLARAKDYLAIAECGDARVAAWKSAADEIIAWLAEDHRRTQREAATALGRSQNWTGTLVRWRTNEPDAVHPPHGGPAQNEGRYERTDRRKVEDIIAERPEAVAEAISKAPAAAQRRLADEILKRPTERSVRALASPTEHKPREPKSAEVKLGDATFALWEVGEMLLDAVPSGEARVRMTALAEKSQRLAAGILHLLGTGELESEFAELVRQVGAES